MEPKLKIISCDIVGDNKALVKVRIERIDPVSYISIEGTHPSPVFIIGQNGERTVASNMRCDSRDVEYTVEMLIINGGESVPVFATIVHEEEKFMVATFIYLLKRQRLVINFLFFRLL